MRFLRDSTYCFVLGRLAGSPPQVHCQPINQNSQDTERKPYVMARSHARLADWCIAVTFDLPGVNFSAKVRVVGNFSDLNRQKLQARGVYVPRPLGVVDFGSRSFILDERACNNANEEIRSYGARTCRKIYSRERSRTAFRKFI